MSKTPMSAILAMVLLGSSAAAQEKAAAPKKPGAPLKVQVVYSRYQGEKKVSSMPYTLFVTADERPTVMRFGLQLPIQTVANSATTVVFKDASTNLDCSAETIEDGRFKLALQLEQGSLYTSDIDRKSMGGSSALANVPLLHTFRSSNTLFLRDGQTVQYIAATDPTNGEVLKIDVSLSVVK
jgi:hypothetical protein